MARTDLTFQEIFDLKHAVRALSNGEPPCIPIMRVRDLVERLTGEVIELRNRESHARQLHDLEGEY